jgi:hypothetical protein
MAAAKPGDGGHVLRPGATLALLRSPARLRQHRRALTNVEGAGTLRSVELVGRQADERRLPRVRGRRRERGGLHRVDVERHPSRPADGADGGHRLECADLVVRGLNAHERRAIGDAGCHLVGVDAAVSVHADDGDLEALPLEHRGRGEDRLVLHGAGHDVPAPRAGRPRHAAHGEIVRLGAAGGEHDLARLRPEVAGDLLARLVECLARATARRVDARRVALVLRQVREHGLEHLGTDRRGGRVIEVDRHRPMIARACPAVRRRCSCRSFHVQMTP